MKRLLLPLLSALTLSTSVHAGISDELHKKCSDARDFAVCINTNKNFLSKKIKKYLE